MFEELTDAEILAWKGKVREFLSGNFSTQTLSDTHTGLTIGLNHQNAWTLLQELTKEQHRRDRGGSPFVALDLRNA